MATGPAALTPQYIDGRDEPWVMSLVTEYYRLVGCSVRQLKRRLQEPLPYYCPRHKLKYAAAALDETFKASVAYPRKTILALRRRAFELSDGAVFAGEELGLRRSALVTRVCAESNLSDVSGFDRMLFADFPNERRLEEPITEPCFSDIMLAANSTLVRRLVMKSERIELLVTGHVRPVIRQAKLRGLISTIAAPDGQEDYQASIGLSGPLELFRHSRVYGTSLAEVVPFLAGCDRFAMTVVVPSAEDRRSYVIRNGDPIFPKVSVKPFDSKVERQFARDFTRATNDFDLIREPKPLRAGGSLIFPDFAIHHRTGGEPDWLLEIVGYWTTAYLRHKVETLRRIDATRMILCIDERLGAGQNAFPPEARIVSYKGRIDPHAVLAAMRSGYSTPHRTLL